MSAGQVAVLAEFADRRVARARRRSAPLRGRQESHHHRGIARRAVPADHPLKRAAGHGHPEGRPRTRRGLHGGTGIGELTPLSSLAIAEARVREAGTPAGVFTIITSSDPAAVTMPLLTDPRLRKLSFTGSTARWPAPAGEERPTRAANVDGAGRQRPIPGLRRRRSRRRGPRGDDRQDAPGRTVLRRRQRLLVQDVIAEDFAAAVAETMSDIRVGAPDREDSELGTLADHRAVDEVQRLVDDAVARGALARAAAPLPPGPGHYTAPRVLDHVPTEAAIMREEVFGPYRRSTGSPPKPKGSPPPTPPSTAWPPTCSPATSTVHAAWRAASDRDGGHQPRPRFRRRRTLRRRQAVRPRSRGRTEGLQEYQQIKILSTPGL